MFLNKHKKLHRNGSIRLRHYNYGQNGYYFVTICTKNGYDVFGKKFNDEIKYNNLGNMVIEQWYKIKKRFLFVELDEFIVMPDHVHGIIIINKKNVNTDAVGTCRGMCLHGHQPNKFGKPQNDSLPMIINHFKGAVTKWTNQNNIPFKWQPRYYEHIIQNERALNNIRRYIRNNPRMWHN